MTHEAEDRRAKPAQEAESKPALTLQDLLNSESEVLRRVARDQVSENQTTAHTSTSGGHKMGGTHTSHTMNARSERPLLD